MRRFWVVVLCGLGLLGLIATTIATTGLLTVLNRSAVVSAANTSLRTKAVQDRLVNNVSIAVLKNMPAAGRTEAATQTIRTAARNTVTDPAFKPLWTSAVSAAYAKVIDGTGTDINLNPELLTGLVRNHLADQSPQIVALLSPSAQLEVPVTTASLPNLASEARIVRIVPYIGAGVALVGYGLAFVISRRRRRTLRGSGWWILFTGVVLLVLAFVAPTVLVPLVRSGSEQIGTAIAGMGWRVWVPAAALTALGFVMALIGVISARRAPENRITRTIVPEPEVAEGQPPVDVWDCRV